MQYQTKATITHKIFETNCLLLFTSSLTAKFARSCHILAKIYFIFLKNVPEQTWNAFNTKFQTQ